MKFSFSQMRISSLFKTHRLKNNFKKIRVFFIYDKIYSLNCIILQVLHFLKSACIKPIYGRHVHEVFYEHLKLSMSKIELILSSIIFASSLGNYWDKQQQPYIYCVDQGIAVYEKWYRLAFQHFEVRICVRVCSQFYPYLNLTLKRFNM